MHRILSIGLGPLGLRVARDLIQGNRGTLVAAVDSAPQLAGRALAELVPGAPARLRILGELERVEGWDRIDCALVTTSSELSRCMPTLRSLLRHGVSVVSSCEELCFPWLRHPELARELDSLCQANGARVLGTGVNPGYLMDALPLFATAVCTRVDSVHVWRIQDAAPRRVQFQRKIGAGLDLASFEARVRAGTLRHVGLGESLHFLAGALGWTVERWEESLEPVIAARALDCELGPIRAGDAAGVRQVGRAWVGGSERLTLEFQAAIAQPDPHDRLRIEGQPVVDLRLAGGVHGDIATSAILINALGPLLAAPAGLHTMATIGIVACRQEPVRNDPSA